MKRFLIAILLLARPAYADPSIQIAFSPDGGSTEAVVAVVASAQKSLHVAAYSFTSRPIAEAIIAAHNRGVETEIVLDKSNATAGYSEVGFVAGNGIPVRIDYRYAIMHNKFIVVDGVTVENGSFNYTTAAERSNAENVLVLQGYPDVARQYEARWQMLWGESQPFQQ